MNRLISGHLIDSIHANCWRFHHDFGDGDDAGLELLRPRMGIYFSLYYFSCFEKDTQNAPLLACPLSFFIEHITPRPFYRFKAGARKSLACSASWQYSRPDSTRHEADARAFWRVRSIRPAIDKCAKNGPRKIIFPGKTVRLQRAVEATSSSNSIEFRRK